MAAVLGTLRKIGLEPMLASRPSRQRTLVVAMIVAAAEPSPAAKKKGRTQHAAEGLPLHRLRSLPADLATLTKNLVRLRETEATFYQLVN